MIYVIYLVVGLLAGIIGGLLGTGGCALIMPVIRFGFNFDPAFAVGTTLTTVVFTAGSGAIQHFAMRDAILVFSENWEEFGGTVFLSGPIQE